MFLEMKEPIHSVVTECSSALRVGHSGVAYGLGSRVLLHLGLELVTARQTVVRVGGFAKRKRRKGKKEREKKVKSFYE